MKILFLFPPIAMLSLFLINPDTLPGEKKPGTSDTLSVKHLLDGSIDEWPVNKFETDKETSIRYAVDNDDKNLYMALMVTDNMTQIKMMRMGMNMYIDIRGKKKENKWVEFPLKREAGSGGFSGSGGGMQRGSSPQQND